MALIVLTTPLNYSKTQTRTHDRSTSKRTKTVIHVMPSRRATRQAYERNHKYICCICIRDDSQPHKCSQTMLSKTVNGMSDIQIPAGSIQLRSVQTCSGNSANSRQTSGSGIGRNSACFVRSPCLIVPRTH